MIDEITCDYIATARPIDRAIVAEMLSNSLHKLTRCNKCQKYHVWVRVSMVEWGPPNALSKEARLGYYTQVGPNAYLHKGLPKKRKKSGKSADDYDEE